MDDMRNTQAPLYGKAEPATAKTTMSVREMQHLLGLGKTDSYWLLHKNFFEVILWCIILTVRKTMWTQEVCT